MISSHNDLVREEPSVPTANALERLSYALEPLEMQDNRQITISYLRLILMVARNPGITVSQLAQNRGAYQATTSRALLELGQKSRGAGPALGLIGSDVDYSDIRYRHYYLTAKGRELVVLLLERLGVTQ